MLDINGSFILIVISIISSTHCVTAQQPDDSYPNCFQEHGARRCEDSWIKICTDYYVCDMIIDLHTPPKRIGYVDGEIVIAIGSQMYNIFNGSLLALPTRKFIPPWDEFVDKKDNRYYAADGTTYMSESETNKEIEILTTGEHSFNQLVYDLENARLFILAFKPTSDEKEKGGSLFAINTSTMNVTEDDKVQAEKVEAAGDRITAMAVQGEVNKLLLGLRTAEGGRLIRLTRQSENPCSNNNVGNGNRRNAIIEVIEEAQTKLIKIFEEISISTETKNSLLLRDNSGSKAVEMDNARLKRELNIATTKLNRLTSRLFVFNRNLRTSDNEFTSTFMPETTTDSWTMKPDSGGSWSPPGPPGPPGPWGPQGPPGIASLENLVPSLKCFTLEEVQDQIAQRTRELEISNMDLRVKLDTASFEVNNMLRDLAN